MITEIGFLIGNSTGDSVYVEADDQGCCMGTFMRIRMKFNVSRPLRRTAKINLGPKHPLVDVLLRAEDESVPLPSVDLLSILLHTPSLTQIGSSSDPNISSGDLIGQKRGPQSDISIDTPGDIEINDDDPSFNHPPKKRSIHSSRPRGTTTDPNEWDRTYNFPSEEIARQPRLEQ